MTYSSRIEAIRAYLKENEELIEKWDKGKLEIHFNGPNISMSFQDIREGIRVQITGTY